VRYGSFQRTGGRQGRYSAMSVLYGAQSNCDILSVCAVSVFSFRALSHRDQHHAQVSARASIRHDLLSQGWHLRRVRGEDQFRCVPFIARYSDGTIGTMACFRTDLLMISSMASGGPHNHQIAALAVQLKEVATPEFAEYAKQGTCWFRGLY